MAYMDQDKKRELVTEAKKVLKKYGVKATFGVHHHSTLICKIKSGPIDFITNHFNTMHEKFYWVDQPERNSVHNIDVNVYHFKDHFSGVALAFLTELLECLNEGNWDKSDSMSDYFNVGWYVSVKIGDWQQSYELTR